MNEKLSIFDMIQLMMSLMCARSFLNEKKWSKDVPEPLGLELLVLSGVGQVV